MQKHESFVITAAVLVTAIAIVALYTVNAAHVQAQPNMTSAGGVAKNMTEGPTKNMSGATVNKTGESLIHKTTPAGIVCTMNQPNEPRIC